MPQEIEVWYLIPAIRRELALHMKSKGLTQKKIAKKLYVTEPAISQYLKNKRAQEIEFSEEIKKEIKKAGDEIIKKSSKVTVVKQTQKILIKIRKTNLLCELHKKMDEHIKCECPGCDCYESLPR